MAQIKKDTSLRKAILQAAITGQLISTCHSELDSESAETGKQLLDRIIEERNKKLITEWEEALKKNVGCKATLPSFASKTRAKKPSPIVASEIDEEEIPFDIPENWCWCRLGDVAEIKSSKRVFEKDYVLDGVPFFRSAEIGDLQQNKALKTELFISEKHFNELKNKYGVPQQGDLLITSVGTIGNTWISDGRDFYYKDGNITQISKNEFIIPEYFRLFIDSPVFTMQVFDTVAGTAYNALTIIKLKKLIFPLPPLAVQNAIVAKLEQVLPLVDAYENALLQKEELKSALPDKVKKAILQEAITGQLTEAWRKSATIKESGKQLLDRIIEERNAKALAEWEESLLIFSPRKSKVDEFSNENSRSIGSSNDATSMSLARKNKKTKKPVPVVASEIEEEDIPFEVPESWCWCRLGDLASIARGGSPRPINDFLTNEPDGYNWIKISDTDKGGKYINCTKQKIKKEGLYKTRLIHKGDFLLTNSMSFGRPYISNIDGCIHDGWLVFSFINELINPDFIYNLLSSPFIYDSFSQSAAGGVVQNLNTDKVIDTLVPLPPLEEQEEIVKKLEELLPLCK